MTRYRRALLGCLLPLMVAIAGHAQTPASPATPPTPAATEAPADSLGRTSPRGTVRGFLAAARRREFQLAGQYLDLRAGGTATETLAAQLFDVLDARLPARPTLISDEPEGSRSNPLEPDRELVGTIDSAQGAVDVFVIRVNRAPAGQIWLFSDATLAKVPALHAEITGGQGTTLLARLPRITIAGARLLEWLAILIGVPLLYLFAVLMNRMLLPLARPAFRRLLGHDQASARNALPVPLRLLLVVLLGRWLLSTMPLSLAARQFGTHLSNTMSVLAVVWLLMLVNAETERYVRRRIPQFSTAAAAALLRVLRRTVDVLIIFGGLLATLRYFDIDPTPALAGLGVGGIAVALAAQKTLENVIAGASLIFDQAVRAGDSVKMGDITGTVEHIGLRSTRLRTMDRTVISIPNSQIASATIETLSARDKHWFHPIVALQYETSAEQLKTIIHGIGSLLVQQPLCDPDSVRVRLLRLGVSSLDVEVVAYFNTRDWNHFLQIQEELLVGMTDLVSRAGTRLALPAQRMYVASR